MSAARPCPSDRLLVNTSGAMYAAIDRLREPLIRHCCKQPTLGPDVALELAGHGGVLLDLDGAAVVAQLQVLHVVRQEDVGALYVPEK